MNNFDYCVFIGRFSIFHNAHLAILEKALSVANQVIVVIGSAGTARNLRNPWTAQERQEMITSSLSKEKLDRIKFVHMRDYLYNNNIWLSVLQEKINVITEDSTNVALIGFESDETSYYLKQFPQFTFVEYGVQHHHHSTQLRDYYFSYDLAYKSCVPAGVADFLAKFQTTPEFAELKQEKNYIDEYKLSWKGAPFPPIFVTVDTLILKSGHILVVERKFNPGKGLLALPGGFIKPMETLEEAALRELKEETGIKINIPELRKAIIDRRIYDSPLRSMRGRTITNAFMIDLGIGPLPKVKADDDALAAFWLPLGEFYTMEEKFFEDHFHIITSLISKY